MMTVNVKGLMSPRVFLVHGSNCDLMPFQMHIQNSYQWWQKSKPGPLSQSS